MHIPCAHFRRPFVKRFALCYRTVVLSFVSETLMYCGQTVGWIKVKLGTQVSIGLGYIVLDGEQLPSSLPQSDTATQFSAHICCGQIAGWI